VCEESRSQKKRQEEESTGTRRGAQGGMEGEEELTRRRLEYKEKKAMATWERQGVQTKELFFFCVFVLCSVTPRIILKFVPAGVYLKS
jgi:hypothetical protein